METNNSTMVEVKEGMIGTKYVGTDSYIVVCLKKISPKKILVKVCYDEIKNHIIKKEDGYEYYNGDIDELLNNSLPKINTTIKDEKERLEIFEWDMKRFYEESTYSQRKNGYWYRKGSSTKYTGSVHWGKGVEYLDPNF